MAGGKIGTAPGPCTSDWCTVRENSFGVSARAEAMGVGCVGRAFGRPCALYTPVYSQVNAVLASLMIFGQIDCLVALCEFLQVR